MNEYFYIEFQNGNLYHSQILGFFVGNSIREAKKHFSKYEKVVNNTYIIAKSERWIN
jgi:hypothetical protein